MPIRTRHDFYNGDGVDFEVRNSGTDYLCIKIRHDKSGYCDRTLIRGREDGKDLKTRIERVKNDLLVTFKVAYAAGSHYEQRHNRGDTRLGTAKGLVEE